jgi:hypothetical protein
MYTKWQTRMFITALFKITTCLLKEWIFKWCYISSVKYNSTIKRNELLLYIAIWMNLKNCAEWNVRHKWMPMVWYYWHKDLGYTKPICSKRIQSAESIWQGKWGGWKLQSCMREHLRATEIICQNWPSVHLRHSISLYKNLVYLWSKWILTPTYPTLKILFNLDRLKFQMWKVKHWKI